MRIERWQAGQLVSSTTVADSTADTVEADLESKAVAALANNATFLAIASPTNAQVLAQTRALTRQVNALIRLSRADLLVDNTDT